MSRPLFFASISVSVTPLINRLAFTSARLWWSVLSSALTCTAPTVTPKLISVNRFLRVDKRIQQRFDFYFALFFTKCLGVHLLVACYPVPPPVPWSSHRSLCRFFSTAALVLAFSARVYSSNLPPHCHLYCPLLWLSPMVPYPPACGLFS